jgi:hypothetical protein
MTTLPPSDSAELFDLRITGGHDLDDAGAEQLRFNLDGLEHDDGEEP